MPLPNLHTTFLKKDNSYLEKYKFALRFEKSLEILNINKTPKNFIPTDSKLLSSLTFRVQAILNVFEYICTPSPPSPVL